MSEDNVIRENAVGDGSISTRERLQSILDNILETQGHQLTNQNGDRVTALLSSQELQRLMAIFSSNANEIFTTADAAVEDDDDDEADYVYDEEEDEVYEQVPTRPWDRLGWWPKRTEPQQEGLDLLYSGEFGRLLHQIQSRANQHNVSRILLNRGRDPRPDPKEDITCNIIPNSNGTAVASYPANAYVGQFSSDSAFYYTCVNNFRLHVYDMTSPIKHVNGRQAAQGTTSDGHSTTMDVIKTIQAAPGRWTITDSHLSPDNQRMIYASISSTVHMCSTLDASTEQIPISFRDPAPSRGRRAWNTNDYEEDEHFGIWSCKFSADGNEVIAGGSSMIFVYDLIANKRTVKIYGHADDVNSCCWADTASGNVLISASDDTFVKVWDRRSLAATRKASGVLIGHTEGITYVSAKGDGRYVISNGKDQILRLWDLRMMRSNSDFESVSKVNYGIPQFDYRGDKYPRPRHKQHPLDCSVMKYTGHAVLRTLIRCHFSPAETTGQQYIYSGSADGKIHIWSLDGRVVQVLDRSYSLPMALDPSAPEPLDITPSRIRPCVRDVSWHSQEPILMSTGWMGLRWASSEGSIIARHEWKGLSKMHNRLEDYLEKQKSEQGDNILRRAARQTGSFQPSSPDSATDSSDDNMDVL